MRAILVLSAIASGLTAQAPEQAVVKMEAAAIRAVLATTDSQFGGVTSHRVIIDRRSFTEKGGVSRTAADWRLLREAVTGDAVVEELRRGEGCPRKGLCSIGRMSVSLSLWASRPEGDRLILEIWYQRRDSERDGAPQVGGLYEVTVDLIGEAPRVHSVRQTIHS